MHNPQLPNREAVARASAWLRQCSGWMLSHDLDMRGDCPMQADPLDLADDLDAALALIPSPDQGGAEAGTIAGEESCFIAGNVWDDGECWTSEIQVVGGHAVVAMVHGYSKANVIDRRDAVLRALSASLPEPQLGVER